MPSLNRAFFDAWVDDDGSGTTGTIWNKTAIDQLLDAVDAALASSFTPTAHATSHAAAGSDPLTLAESQITNLVSDLSTLASGLAGKASSTDPRLTDARTPTAHASSHQFGGGDAIKLDDLAAPDDNTDLNASTSAHGLAPKLPGNTTTFLRGDGTYAVPPGGGGGAGTGNVTGPATSTVGHLPTFNATDGTLLADSGIVAANVVLTSDSRLSDARTPTAHATSHKSGGSDAIKLDELAAPTDVTTLNVSTTAHGLTPKLPNDAAKFLNGIGTYTVPWTVISNTTTGAQNNWAPAGLLGNTLIEWNGASDAAFTGLAGGFAGQIVTVKNTTTTRVATFAPLSGSSSAANQFTNYATVGNTPIAAGGSITYQHDGTNWKITAHEQGASIVPAYNAGDYTAATGNWTVDAGDVIGVSYILRGRQLTVLMNVNSTSVSATPVSLRRAIPGGFQGSAAGTLIDTFLGNPGGTFQLAQLNVGAGGGVIIFYSSISTAGTWGTTTNSTSVACNVTFEVQ